MKCFTSLPAIIAYTVSMMLISPAAADMVCNDADVLRRLLKANHSEIPAEQGVTTTGELVQVLVADDGSWTVLVINGEGHACLVAVGQEWRTQEAER